MATAAAKGVKDFVFEWEGKDRNGKIVKGELRAGGEAMVSATLRRQGILVNKVKKRRASGGSRSGCRLFSGSLSTSSGGRRGLNSAAASRR